MSETSTDEGTAEGVPASGPVDPASIPERDLPPLPREPARTRWTRRGIIALVLLVAFGVLAWGTRDTVSGDDNATGEVVERLQPPEGAVVLRQEQVIATLREGFDGRLTINGVAVPEEQMEGVVDPDSPEATLPDGSPTQLRPNNRRTVAFLAGPGKVFDKLPQGVITVTVSYFRDGQPTVDRGSTTWTFTAN